MTTETGTELVHLDPQQLTPHPDNPRADLDDLDELTASVAELGVIQALVAVPEEAGLLIVAGNRRHAAALAAGAATVPVWVRPDLAGLPIEQVGRMIAENVHRKDLTDAEEAKGYEQLRMLGLSATKIREEDRRERARVQTALKVGGSETARAVLDRYPVVTLEQAAVVAQYDDDDDAVKRLTVAAVQKPEMFDHLVAQLEEERTERAKVEAAAARYRADGFVVITPGEDDDDPSMLLRRLVDVDGEGLDEDHHRSNCPGHAIRIMLDPYHWHPEDADEAQDSDDGLSVEAVCLDPGEHGHETRTSRLNGSYTGAAGSTSPPPTAVGMTEDQKAERRKVVANNKAWPAAATVRRRFVRELLQRRQPPKELLRWVILDATGSPESLNDGDDERVADLLGVTVEAPSRYERHAVAAWAENQANNRLAFGLFAQCAARHEDHLDPKDSWRNFSTQAARYLEFIATLGYSLSEIEQDACREAHERAARYQGWRRSTDDVIEDRDEVEQQDAS